MHHRDERQESEAPYGYDARADAIALVVLLFILAGIVGGIEAGTIRLPWGW